MTANSVAVIKSCIVPPSREMPRRVARPGEAKAKERNTVLAFEARLENYVKLKFSLLTKDRSKVPHFA